MGALLLAHYRGKSIDPMRCLGAFIMTSTIPRALTRYGEDGRGGDETTPPTPAHDSVSGYVATYTKGYVRLCCDYAEQEDKSLCNNDQEGICAQEDLVLTTLSGASRSIL
jgi:hypothetical protein